MNNKYSSSKAEQARLFNKRKIYITLHFNNGRMECIKRTQIIYKMKWNDEMKIASAKATN